MKPKRYGSEKSLELREYILKIARKCVEQFGLRATTILKVSEMVGVSRQTVHSHFRTKEVLLGEVIFSYMMEGINQTLARIDLTKPARTVLEDTLRHMLKHMRRPMGQRLMEAENRDVALKAAATQNILKVYVARLWLPILTEFGKGGHLRPGVDLADTGKWLFMIQYAVLDISWMKARDLHRLVETFVVPSVLRD